MGAAAEMDGVSVETGQLGEAQARLGREQQQRVIASSKPCRSIGNGQDCLDLRSGQEMRLTLVVPLAGYRKDALNMRAVGWLLERREPEERAYGGQPQITRPDAGAPVRLEILEKRADELRVQIIERQGRRRLVKPLMANMNSSRNVSL